MSLPRSAKAFIEQAEAEGLTLLTADNASGYKGVVVSSSKTKPYQAKLKRGGKSVTLGFFATAEEAALIIARDSAAQAAAPPPPPASSRKRKVKSEEQPPDMPAGARVKCEEQPPPMSRNAVVKLEFES